jgi:hypothetical protein
MSITVKNIVTGVISIVPDHYLNHPILGAELATLEDVKAAPKKETKLKEQPAPEETITEEQV